MRNLNKWRKKCEIDKRETWTKEKGPKRWQEVDKGDEKEFRYCVPTPSLYTEWNYYVLQTSSDISKNFLKCAIQNAMATGRQCGSLTFLCWAQEKQYFLDLEVLVAEPGVDSGCLSHGSESQQDQCLDYKSSELLRSHLGSRGSMSILFYFPKVLDMPRKFVKLF